MALITAGEARTETNADSLPKEEQIREFWTTIVDPKIRRKAKNKQFFCSIRSRFTLEEIQEFVTNENLGFTITGIEKKKVTEEDIKAAEDKKKKFPIPRKPKPNPKTENTEEAPEAPEEDIIVAISWEPS